MNVIGSTAMDDIPEEVLLQIFEYLDTTPPSELKSRQEPNLELTSSHDRPLKNVCCTSKVWRRIALPLLFKCARLRLNVLGDFPTICSTCTGLRTPVPSEATEDEHYHGEMIGLANQIGPVLDAMTNLRSSPPKCSGAIYAIGSHHQLQDFLSFMQVNGLAPIVTSFVLVTDSIGTSELSRCSHDADEFYWFYRGSAMLWRQLLSAIDPRRISILACPTDLACLTNAAVDSSGVSLFRKRFTSQHD